MNKKSFIEINKIAELDAITPVQLMGNICYDYFDESQKPDVFIVKESFILRDKKFKTIGVYTRTNLDHKSKIGDCSIVLSSDFDKSRCQIDGNGKMIYDVSSGLRMHFGLNAALFKPENTHPILISKYVDAKSNKKYINVFFDVVLFDPPAPIAYKLDTRLADHFIGLRTIGEIQNGLKRFNKGEFNIDMKILNLIKGRRGIFRNIWNKISGNEIDISAVKSEIAIIKINVIGS